jgi:hypothetical protein
MEQIRDSSILGHSKRLEFVLNLFVFVLIICLFAIQYSKGWFYLGGRDGFGDLSYVLERIPCLERDWNLLYGPRTEAICTGYIYGSSLLYLFGYLGISLSNLVTISYLLIVSLLLVMFLTIRTATLSLLQRLIAIALFFSPPIVLLTERLNVDLMIFLAIYVAAKLPNGIAKLLSPILVSLTALFKFYTFPIFFIMLRQYGRVSRYYLILIICMSSIVIAYDLKRLSYVPWDARNMFGNSIWGEYAFYIFTGPQSRSPIIISMIVGLSVFCLIFFFMQRLAIEVNLRSITSQSDKRFFLYLFIITISCYFTGLNVDYRLVFLLFLYLCAEKMFFWNLLGKILLRASILISFFFSYNVELLQPVGDFALIIVLTLIIKCYQVLFGNSMRDMVNEGLEVCRVILTRITGNTK